MQQRARKTWLKSLNRVVRGGTRGTTFVEYMAAVGAFGIVVAAVMTTRAESLVTDYANARDLVLLPAL